jgi:hypothetical protein
MGNSHAVCNIGDGTYTRNGPTLTLSATANRHFAELGRDEVNLPAEQHIREVLAPGEVQFELVEYYLSLTRGSVGLSALPYAFP